MVSSTRHQTMLSVIRIVVGRILGSLLVLLAVMTFVFFANRLIGDPALMLLGPNAPEAALEQLRGQLGLSDPLLEQYIRFIAGVAQGDMGSSFRFGLNRWSGIGGVSQEYAGVPVMPLVLERLPATFYLAATAMTIALVTALPLGILAAMYPRSSMDRIISVFSLAGVSLVEFWAGMMLIIFFALQLGLLPTSGYGGPEFVVLPAIALAIAPAGRIVQLTRSAMLDELAKPYIQTARGKGLSPLRIAGVHALKNAGLPIITVIGNEATAMLTGVIIIEVLFAWPGIGSLTIDALSRRDLPLVECTVFVLTLIVIGINLLVDLLYLSVNPQSRSRGLRGAKQASAS